MNVEEFFRKKGLEDTRTEAAVKRTILIVIAVIFLSFLLVYTWVVYLLMKNLLYGKSKLVRMFSALGLVGIAIGTILLVRYKLIDYYTSEPSRAVSHQSSDCVNRDNITKVSQPVPESADLKTEGGGTHPTSTEDSTPIPVIKNSAGEYDWQSMCQKEWPKAFSEIQKAFSVFGGFQLVRNPIDGHGDEKYWKTRENVSLQKPYRYFQKADLKFFHGALVEFKLKAHFPVRYSKATIDRECKALQDDVIEKLKHLNKHELGIEFEGEEGYGNIRTVRFGPSVHKFIGVISTAWALQHGDDGYDLILSVYARGLHNGADVDHDLISFIELVMEKDAYEAGDELEGFDKKQKSNDDSIKEHQALNRAIESADHKTETPTPSSTIPASNGKEVSPDQTDESTDSQPQTVAQPNPHFEAARKHDWQSMCQKEWGKAFVAIQDAISVFGGFRLAQPPIDGVEFDTEDVQKDIPLLKQYRYFKKADMEFFNGALVGFTLKAHFAKSYSKASVEREYKALQNDVVKKIECLKRPELGIGLASTSTYFEYGQSRNPSAHNIVGRICISCDLRQDADGYDLTLNIDATRGLTRFMELTLKKEADEAGDELEEFDKKHPAKGEASHKDDNKQSSVERTSKPVKITGFGSYKFGQKYPATRMTAEMRQEGGLAIKPVQTHYRKFRTLELGYAIDGKQLCQIKLCAEFPSNVDDSLLNKELMNVKGEVERQFGCEMTESGDRAYYEDENYVVKLWHQATTKTVYKTRHVGFRNQRTASTVDIKGLYLLLEDKRLMPK